ncbi:MAG TPA: SUMF1/EgtB/PvdO family nonheme iron enzyme [Thermoanaerobaculia bacterium]|jgi:iron(II)-dependent oxidoreductase|nr:SUMF1/EgtB/PvdO family nonheme iron enzyme [Thermoanaerobaculia bacterium]
MTLPSPRTKGEAFEALVANHYASLGYKIKRHVDVLGQEVDILAVLQLPDGEKYSVMIECKYHHDRSSGNSDVQSIAGAFSIAKLNNVVQACVIVAPTGFSLPAQQAAAAAGIRLMTQSELEKMTFEVPLRYALPLRAAYQRANASLRTFVPGRARKRPTNAPINLLADYLLERSTAASPDVTVMLGGIGTGKTTHCYALAQQLTSDYLSGSRVPLGIYIPLERFTRHREGRYFDEFVVDYLRTIYRMDVAWSDILRWLEQHTALFIVDGFDEIARMHSETAVVDEFCHIVGAIGRNTATLLSCRTTVAAIVAANLPAFFERQLVDLDHHSAEVIEVDLFTPAEVITYINAVGQSAKRLLKRTSASHLLQRPLLLDTVIGALSGRLPSTKHIETPAALIDYCVTYVLQHKTSLRHAGISVSEWRTFLEECALAMMLGETRYTTASDLANLVKKYFVSAVEPEKLRLIEFDASVRTVLDFDIDAGGLRWNHAIFRDLLAASAIARRLIVPRNTDSDLHGRFLSLEQLEFVQYAVDKRRSDWKAVVEFRRPRPAPPPITRNNAWQWISPGLSVIGDLSGAGARLVFFEKGYWISEQPLTLNDLKTIGFGWLENDQRRANKTRLRATQAPVTYVTHQEATNVAAAIGGRLPAEIEWERAARWIDSSYPRDDVIPSAEAGWATPPLVTNSGANPWGVRNIVGCVWQWTSTFDAAAQRYICRGPWWGAAIEEKRNPIKRLVPNEPDHVRTGIRVVKDADKGGSF